MGGEKQMAELLWDRPQEPQRGSGCTYTGASQGLEGVGPRALAPRTVSENYRRVSLGA